MSEFHAVDARIAIECGYFAYSLLFIFILIDELVNLHLITIFQMTNTHHARDFSDNVNIVR